MKKKTIILITLIIFGIGIFLTYNQLNHTSYENVMSEMIDESEEIWEITVENKRSNTEVTIKDKELFKEIIDKPNDMELKKQNDIPSIDYFIIIQTNKRNYDIGLGEKGIHFGYAGSYSIVSDNILYQNISHLQFQ